MNFILVEQFVPKNIEKPKAKETKNEEIFTLGSEYLSNGNITNLAV